MQVLYKINFVYQVETKEVSEYLSLALLALPTYNVGDMIKLSTQNKNPEAACGCSGFLFWGRGGSNG